jgi:hypothetical protein
MPRLDEDAASIRQRAALRGSHGREASHLHVVASQVFQDLFPASVPCVRGTPGQEKQGAEVQAKAHHDSDLTVAMDGLTFSRPVPHSGNQGNGSFSPPVIWTAEEADADG